jgi:hypothetical protein
MDKIVMKKICTKCKNGMKVLCKLDGSQMRYSKCGACKQTFCDYCLMAGEWKSLKRHPDCKARTKFEPPICFKCYIKYWKTK